MNGKRNKLFIEEILKALRKNPKTTIQLYKIIKQKCPKYCDDSEICTCYTITPSRQPEWKHRVRCVQNSMQKDFFIYNNKESGK